ncbi:MAG: sulfatase-like hydrolase/transferase, partial [Alistipes sp.]|nr:sulfatase-like hydrolase/transferase [Alistipes sp.]
MAIPIALMYLRLRGYFSWSQSLGNALLVIMPFVLLPPRFRWTVLFPVWLTAIFYESNLLYWRFFRDFIPLRDYFLFQNFDPITFNAGLSMAKVVDLALILPAISASLIYFIWLRKPAAASSSRFSVKSKIIAVVVSILCFAGSELWHVYYYSKQPILLAIQDRYNIKIKRNCVYAEYNTTSLVTYIAKGLICELYLAFCTRELDDAEHAAVAEFWNRHRSVRCQLPDSTASVFARNRDKNLILIVVESLNAEAVDYEYGGRRLMPVLSDLIDADGSISALEVVSQVRSGVSSDGQLMLNSGLYPSSDCTTVEVYGDNDFPSLAKILKEHFSFEAICESEVFWNHSVTNRSYGYDALVSNTNKSASEQDTGFDGALFDTSLAVVDSMPRPLFAFLTTISMHSPYNGDKNVRRPQWISDIPDIPDAMRDYLTVTNYFDAELGRFIDGLKQRD